MQLLLLLSLFCFSFALGSPSDVLYIKKLVADEAHLIDAKDYRALANIFTKDAAYNFFNRPPTSYGLEIIESTLESFFPGLITQNSISTESITLKPPFDEQGAASTATGFLDTSIAYIGQGNLTGQALILWANYRDNYVKTGDFALYGGWRICNRTFILTGRAGNTDILPPSQRAEANKPLPPPPSPPS